jgi:hypothetical protein
LLAEIALFALAMGFTRLAFTWRYEDSLAGATYYTFGMPLVVLAAVVCWGAAIGGLARRQMQGIYFMYFAVLVLILLALMLPAALSP